jgi:mannose-6-phosphate isomerase
MVHAIDAGNLILEIQQNSDTTYRVYDWGRVGLDGRPRALHVRESLASILFEGADEPRLVSPAVAPTVLADCAEFRLRRVPLAAGQTLAWAAGEQPRLVAVVAGAVGTATGTLRRGDNALVPWSAAMVLTGEEDSVLLVTENFA